MMLFLAGAQKIDLSLYEAATLDGASTFRQFLHVTLPGVREEITIAGVITTIAALASFDLVFVTTNGGPAGQTNVPGLLVYRLAFNEGDIGGASALAVVLTVIVIAVVGGIRYFTRDEGLSMRGGVGLRYGVLVLLTAMILRCRSSASSWPPCNPPGAQLDGLSIPDRWSWENFALAWQQANFTAPHALQRRSSRPSWCRSRWCWPRSPGYGLADPEGAGATGRCRSRSCWASRCRSRSSWWRCTSTCARSVSPTPTPASSWPRRRCSCRSASTGCRTHFSNIPGELARGRAHRRRQRTSPSCGGCCCRSRGRRSPRSSVLYFMWSWNQFLLVTGHDAGPGTAHRAGRPRASSSASTRRTSRCWRRPA